MLDALSDTARTWILMASIAAASFGAGAGFMGWVNMPGKLQAQQQAISILADNQMTLAEQLATVRCQLDDLSSYECSQLQARYKRLLEDPGEG